MVIYQREVLQQMPYVMLFEEVKNVSPAFQNVLIFHYNFFFFRIETFYYTRYQHHEDNHRYKVQQTLLYR